ncbi:MAG: acyl-ACP--UDP-N-acetylglucosamine O-acyltransferase [bacterium]|nr:acyl-ACP--UDP-N-acetylglucosamine O-acyltransferase [bacterium]
MVEIHPTAIVDPKAELGDGVIVGPYSIIEGGAQIGANTIIQSHVFISQYTKIGKNCTIGHSSVLGTNPQDLKFKNEPTYTIIGENNLIREYVTINRGTTAHGETKVGNDCLIMAYVHIAHDCIVGNGVILANCVNMAGHTEINDYVNIGGLVPIHQFVRIGAYAFIGGGYRVPKDVPPFALAIGDPLRYSKLNVVGLKRRGFTSETLKEIQKAYRIIYNSGLNIAQGLQKVKNELPQTPEINMILEFFDKTKRGVIGGSKSYSKTFED